jgi:hypothetical protein
VIPNVVWAADQSTGFGPGSSTPLLSVPNDPDVVWLAHHTTAPAAGVTEYYP